MTDQMKDLVRRARAAQVEIDSIIAVQTAAPQRRAPRKLEGKRIVKLRITADSEADAEQARALLEQLLASLQCRMQTPRALSNPKYAAAPKWMSYGDFVLPAAAPKRRKKV